MITRFSVIKRTYLLLVEIILNFFFKQLEKFTERQNSFGGIYKNVDELIFHKNKEFNKNDFPPKFIKNPTSNGFSKFKIINRFKVLKAQNNGDKMSNIVVLKKHIS